MPRGAGGLRHIPGLRRVREQRLLTQAEISERAGVTISTISRLESGLQGARYGTIRKLAEALGVEPRELLDGERGSS